MKGSDILTMYENPFSEIKLDIRYRGGLNRRTVEMYAAEELVNIVHGDDLARFNSGESQHLRFGAVRYGTPVRKAVLFIGKNSLFGK